MADLRARLLHQRGDAEGVRRELEAELADLKERQGLAKEVWGKNHVVLSLVHSAAKYGQPELGLKAAQKLPKGERPAAAPLVAAGFLPADPARALAALETLGGDRADHSLLTRPGDRTKKPFFVALWSAVLGA